MCRSTPERARQLRPRTCFGLALALLASACTVPVCPPSAYTDGRQLYADACAACHGPGGRGDGPVAAALKTFPPDLTMLAQTHGGRFPRDLVIATVAGERDLAAHGTREMPAWSQRFGPGGAGAPGVAAVYTHRNLELLTDYLASMQVVDSR